MKKYLTLLIIGVCLLISGIVYVVFNKNVSTNLGFTPRPTTLSKQAPVLTDSYKGTLNSFNSNSISVSIGSSVQSFKITDTADYQGVTYGSLEEGNAVTVPSSQTELMVGKQVYVVVLKGTDIVKSLYIFR